MQVARDLSVEANFARTAAFGHGAHRRLPGRPWRRRRRVNGVDTEARAFIFRRHVLVSVFGGWFRHPVHAARLSLREQSARAETGTFSFSRNTRPAATRSRQQPKRTIMNPGTAIARPFLPAKDFDRSKSFYEALGFVKELDAADVAIFRAGRSSFLLQRRFQTDWAENSMMQLMVDDLDAWWTHLASLDLPKKFGVPAPKPPALQPWGLRVAFVADPSGVLWHIAQRRPGIPHDQ